MDEVKKAQEVLRRREQWQWRQERRVLRIEANEGTHRHLDFGAQGAILFEIGVLDDITQHVARGVVKLHTSGFNFFTADAAAIYAPCRIEPAVELDSGIFITLERVDRWLDIIFGLYFKVPKEHTP